METKQLSLFSGETIDPGTNPSEKALNIASLRAELLELYKDMEEIYRASRRARLTEDFLEAYNGKDLPSALCPLPSAVLDLREQLGPISRATLYGWLQAYREGGIDALVPMAKPRKVTRAERRCLTEILMDGVGIGRAIFVCKYFLKRKGTPSPSSPATLRRWANKQIGSSRATSGAGSPP